MIRQATALGLLLTATLNVTLPLAAEADKDCNDKRRVLQEKIETAQRQGNTAELDGLHRALGNVDAYCNDVSLHRQRLASVEEARQEVEQRKLDLREAMGQGAPEKIAKHQAKLAEARAELEQAEAEARAVQ